MTACKSLQLIMLLQLLAHVRAFSPMTVGLGRRRVRLDGLIQRQSLACSLSLGHQSEDEEIQKRKGIVNIKGRSVVVQPALQRHLKEMAEGGSVRQKSVRQHVNPLAASFQAPVVLPGDWYETSFEHPHRPLHVDIGCAKGTFAKSMAEAHPEQNFLGLEIRRPVAATALVRAAGTRLRNLHFICCNANVDLEKILSRAASQGAMVETISIQFPPKLVKTIEKHLVPGGKLFMQGDVLEVLEEMREMVREKSEAWERRPTPSEKHGIVYGKGLVYKLLQLRGVQSSLICFSRRRRSAPHTPLYLRGADLLTDSEPDFNKWMEGEEKNPMGVMTEREVATYGKGQRVYRCVFLKQGGRDAQ